MKGRSASPCSSAGWRFWRWRRALAPRRPLSVARGFRWINNIALIAVGTAALRLVFPVLAVVFAGVAQQRGWGLFNLVAAPYWLAVAAVVPGARFRDLLQHRLFHAVPWLWRLHMVHHADPDIDASTGVRFHPIEIVLSMVIKFGAIALLGAPAARRAAVRDRAQRHLDVQPCQLAPAARPRPRAALDRGDAGHAPRPPFHHPARDRQQFRLQFPLVGPAVRQLPRPARGRPRRA